MKGVAAMQYLSILYFRFKPEKKAKINVSDLNEKQFIIAETPSNNKILFIISSIVANNTALRLRDKLFTQSVWCSP
jgi:hypothetical protein